jgi:hypothetical protein
VASPARPQETTGEWVRDAVDVAAIAAVLLAMVLFVLSG